jgi:hypothetical protein
MMTLFVVTTVLMVPQVYAVLSEYTSGVLVQVHLHATHFEDKYHSHMNILGDTKRDFPHQYRRLASKFFAMVYGLVSP